MPKSPPPHFKPGVTTRRTRKERTAIMNLIRRKLIDAKSPIEVADELKIPISTFYDYYRKIAREDKEAIKILQNSDILAHQFMILYNRLHKYLRRAEEIYVQSDAYGVKVAANHQCEELAINIMRLHVAGPQAVGIKIIDEEQKKLYKLSSSSAQIAKEAGLVNKLDGYNQVQVEKALDTGSDIKDDSLEE